MLESIERRQAEAPQAFAARPGLAYDVPGLDLHDCAVEDRAQFHYFLDKTYGAAGVLDRALLHLRKPLEDGFQDDGQIARDPAFAELVTTEAYAQLTANPPVPLP